jgi:hypothetical protein
MPVRPCVFSFSPLYNPVVCEIYNEKSACNRSWALFSCSMDFGTRVRRALIWSQYLTVVAVKRLIGLIRWLVSVSISSSDFARLPVSRGVA